MSVKNLKKALKKITKSKDEIHSDMVRIQKIEHMKKIVREVYPVINEVDSIYDGQTTVNALAGFLMALVEQKASEIKVGDLELDLSKEEDSKIKDVIIKLKEMFKDEPAKEFSSILERFGKTMGDYGANEFLKNKMTELPIDKILA